MAVLEDAVAGAGYIARFAASIRSARVEMIAGAGHLAELDRPRETARAILEFLA